MDRSIRIGVYRILRKLGANREDICLNSKLSSLIDNDAQEWTVLLFFLESKFDIFINKQQEKAMITVEDTIEIVRHNLNKILKITNNTDKKVLVYA